MTLEVFRGTELLQTASACPGDEMMEKLLQKSIQIFSPEEDASQALSEGEDMKVTRQETTRKNLLQC